MAQVKTAISIPDTLLDQAQTIADEMQIPRSQVFALALEDYVRRYRNRQILEQINAAVDSLSPSEEQENSELYRSHQRGILRGVEWE